MIQEIPTLTIEKFDEENLKLHEVYRNNLHEIHRTFMEKMQKLFSRLSPEDQEAVKKRELEKMNQTAATILHRQPGIVDVNGKKMTEH